MRPDKGNPKQGIHSRRTRKQIFRIFLIQALVTLTVGLILSPLGLVEAYSALLGGGLYLLPNIYFAHRALQFREKQSARMALTEMYVSQIWKMAISAIGFAIVFVMIQPLNPFSLFGTFILIQILGWIAQMKLNNRFLKL